MSNALLRRNSSKQGLQNLMRLTAQRSIEDAEEVEREHRRRAREALEHTNSGSTLVESSPENGMPTEENMYNRDFKPSSSPSLEEDEGFSDWTQRRERQRQQHLQELSQGGEEDEEENTINKAASVKTVRASVTSSSRLQGLKQEETDRARMEAERRKEHEEEVIQAERARREKERVVEEKRKSEEGMTSRRVFLHQQPKHSNSNGDATNEEVASHINSKTKRSTRAMEPEEAEAILETEQCLEKIRRGFQVKESQKLEQLKSRREDRHRVREEYEHQREEEEQQRLAKEEGGRRWMKEDNERRRVDTAERMKSLSTSSVDGDEMFSPFSPQAPTYKITERKESLNHLLKKSNSFKKTQPLILMSKIDDKLEQYAHAVEEAQAVKASMTDLPSSPEVISSKKNLFEAGEAWSQSPTKGATCKDVKPGGVMQKKNMWEVIGDASGRPRQRTNKGSATCKKYKFVVTGHGKYEKIPVDKENH
ncbi:putative non-muscle caldesmon-like [Scophthalmus maximus]|uniref:Putative non-muscle caldesmon-like n=1 Tax=Scophthalmus maximus TaxID=52904 RepID=A0A2U9BV18_SCOMX|nr:putative non-muscle caldesmon-like [Scophthalmus maximus]